MNSFEDSILRVLKDGSVVGAAFLVSDRLIATCAHVVNSAGGKVGGTISLKLADGTMIAAEVLSEYWREENAEDVAILHLEKPLVGTEPLPLGSSEGTKGHGFSTFGFPRPSQELAGHGEILGVAILSDIKLLQLDSRQVTPGYSGAPILDEITQRVVGMVVAIIPADEYQRQGTTAFAIPTETIRQICPKLQILDICPYRSLNFFTEEDAAFFHGRSRVIEKMLESLRGQPRFLAVLGPSGSGKSSVVRAGLVSALRNGKLPGSKKWGVLISRPHNQPFDQLASSGLEDPRSGLVGSVQRWLASHGQSTRLVLVIDQFEELLVNVPEDIRQEFITQLSGLLDGVLDVSVVIVMRDDFYSRFQQIASNLTSWQERGTVNIPSMLTESELQDIMLAPARQVGLDFEEGLIDTILADAMETTGSARSTILPLLEFTLTQLWEGRQDGYLLHTTYRDLGGVSGGLAQWADRAYHALEESDRSLARRILTDLVRLGDSLQDLPDTKQRRVLTDLCRTLAEQDHVMQVIHLLADARLLATWRDGQEEYVELIHDALIREWRQLQTWLEQDRSLLTRRAEVHRAAVEWTIHQSDESYLLHRGPRLHEVSTLLSHPRLLLNDSGKRYLMACTENERERSILSVVARVSLIQAGDSDNSYATLEVRLESPQEAVRLSKEPAEETTQTVIKLDTLTLGQLRNDGNAYSRRLTELFFNDPIFQAEFSQIFAAIPKEEVFVVQVVIDANVPQAHDIAWELLCYPPEAQPLSLNSQVIFLRQNNNPRNRLRSRRDRVHLLAVYAGPGGALEQVGQTKITGADWFETIKANQPDIEIKAMSAKEATPVAIREALVKGTDILYLICPWSIEASDVLFWPASSDGTAAFSLQNLMEMLLAIDNPPRLFVLESNLTSDQTELGNPRRNNSFAALATRLIGSGLAAALLFPSGTTMSTRDRLPKNFLQEVLKDGNIGRAMRMARASIENQPDWWQAVLYSFTASGRLWYQPGFAEGKIHDLVQLILGNRYTAIVGPGLAEWFMGSATSLARKWASRYDIPTELARSFNLPEIAQFIATRESRDFVHRAYRQNLQDEITRRGWLPENLRHKPVWSNEDLYEALVTSVSFSWAKDSTDDPYHLLARQPFAVYVTTAYDNLLAAALRAMGKDPQIRFFPWNNRLEQIYQPYEDEPTADQPLVYHLLGNLDELDSLVITQDQYFDFLIGLTKNADLIPVVVRYSLVDQGLLFLGFREDDLGFQLLLRYLESLPGAARREAYLNVMQAEPSTNHRSNLLLVQKMKRHDCSVFWGSPHDLVRGLHQARKLD